MDPQTKLTICLKEAEFVQAVVARFDNNGLNVKSWCLPTWSAISVYAIQNRKPLIALLGLVVLIGFGFTELIYRRFQIRFVDRAVQIEAALNEADLSNYNYSLNKAAFTNGGRHEIRRALRQPQFTVYYSLLITLSLALVVYLWLA